SGRFLRFHFTTKGEVRMSAHEPLRIEADVLYPLDWIEERLQGVLSVKTFLENVGLDCTGRGRIYQNAVWGHEILRAMESTCEGLKTRQNANTGVYERSAGTASAVKPEKRKPGRPRKGVDLISCSDL